ncbi:uncharacterized protein LOC126586970 [Malus sylvestris]|uniref:uncharacterized protein LOC126586970 n=1 Tax=Malus sylvestris TaxID=3752 RepID=UPI0021ACF050|nr:uncharacterized protein LOC126586970 [Malus sylvestris]
MVLYQVMLDCIDAKNLSGSGGGMGFGLTPPSKFRSGHLPSNVIQVRTIPAVKDGSASVSDNDGTIDSEDGVYGGRYSLDLSLQDDRVRSGAAHKYGKPSQGQTNYGSDSTYSDVNVSSLIDTVVGRQKPVQSSFQTQNPSTQLGLFRYILK